MHACVRACVRKVTYVCLAEVVQPMRKRAPQEREPDRQSRARSEEEENDGAESAQTRRDHGETITAQRDFAIQRTTTFDIPAHLIRIYQ